MHAKRHPQAITSGIKSIKTTLLHDFCILNVSLLFFNQILRLVFLFGILCFLFGFLLLDPGCDEDTQLVEGIKRENHKDQTEQVGWGNNGRDDGQNNDGMRRYFLRKAAETMPIRVRK